MIDFLRICGFSAICSAIILMLSKKEQELSSLISSLVFILACSYILFRGENLIRICWQYFPTEYVAVPFSLLLNLGGISFGCVIASSLCECAGQKAIANAIELLGTVEILFISAPTVLELLQRCFQIIGV